MVSRYEFSLKRSNSARFLLLFVFLVALSLRVWAMNLFGSWELGLNPNADEPSQIAAHLVSGEGFTFDFYGLRPEKPLRSYLPPLYPLLMAACLRFSSRPAFALEAIQAFLSALICLFIYVVGRTLSDRRIGLLAAAQVAVYPVFVIQAVEHIPFTLNTFLLAALMAACMWLLRRPTAFSATVVGFLLGLNGLARPSTLGLLPGIVGWLWLNRQEAQVPWKRCGLLIALSALLTLAPWMLRNLQVQGHWVFISTNGGYNLWIGNNPFSTGSGWDVNLARYEAYTARPLRLVPGTLRDGVGLAIPYPLPNEVVAHVDRLPEVDLDRALFTAALNFMRDHPGEWVRLLLRKIVYFWWFRLNIGSFAFQRPVWWILAYQLQYLVVLLLSCVGLVVSLRRWCAYALIYYLLAYNTGVYMLFFVLTRYRWEIESFLLVFTALGTIALWHQVRSPRSLTHQEPI